MGDAKEATPLLGGSSEGSDNAGHARKAFQEEDEEGSRLVHMLKEPAAALGLVETDEKHKATGDVLKSVTFGGLDGILTSFAVVAGAAGGGLGWEVVLVMGISNVLADALSMGCGEFLSSRAEKEWMLEELNRERWELENYEEGEFKEMIGIYKAKGVSEEDANLILRTMLKYKEFFVQHMMAEELGMIVDEEDDTLSSVSDGVVMFLSFTVFGSCPVLVYAIFPPLLNASEAGEVSPSTLFTIACVVTGITLFALGALKAAFSTSKWYIAGSETLLLGSACAAVAFVVGQFVDGILDHSQ